MFSPKWAKEAKLLHKGAKKFLDYKRDLLKPERIEEIEAQRAALLDAIKAGQEAKAAEAGKTLRKTCEKALPSFPQQSWWEEQVEVIWVALVIALGLRAYVLQPFRIPTGSMQPTLNGIQVRRFEDPNQKAPNFLTQGLQMITRGRSYTTIVAKGDGHVMIAPGGYFDPNFVKDKSWMLFTKTEITLSDGSVYSIPAAINEATSVFNNPNSPNAGHFKKGEVIFSGWIDSGDLVLVDKISYNFRKPKRGEVFVFDTRGLDTKPEEKGKRGISMDDQEGGTHFIKRLCGVPGDEIRIQQPNVFVNGQIATEPGMQRVMQAQGIYGPPEHQQGYSVVNPDYQGMRTYINSPTVPVKLAKDTAPGMREYLAMGDNTGNSLDSRFWGPVKEYNLVGAGFFSLWPFDTGHWGFIR